MICSGLVKNFWCPHESFILKDNKTESISSANSSLSSLKTVVESPVFLLYDKGNMFSLASLLL